MLTIDRTRLTALLAHEIRTFNEKNPRSKTLFERAKKSLPGGVPMPWMNRWASPYPLFIERAHGACVQDVDGHEYVDLCLGDTGALFGHSPEPVARAIAEQSSQGFSYMLPTEDAVWVGEELGRRFGLPYWQFAMTATDANRFAIKAARAVTGRTRIAVFNGCYHGSLDETLVSIQNGVMSPLASNMGPSVDPAETTRIVEFNDVESLEKVLVGGDIACLLCEPVLTNIGLVFPEAGFHEAARELTRKYGTMLIVDETHTICAGPGGATRELNLDPDMMTIGKPLSCGIPAAVYGMSENVGRKIENWAGAQGSFVTGIGGTLAGNAFSIHAMRASLEHVMTDEAYASMTRQAERLVNGVREIIGERELPWSVARLGARVEFRFYQREPRNASEATLHQDDELDQLFRLYFLNRGMMLTIFYNVALVSPATTAKDIDRYNAVFLEFVQALAGDLA